MAHTGAAAIAVLLAIIVAAVGAAGQPPASSELAVLAKVKAGLDPSGAVLASWNASAPCSTWLGLVCDTYGHVISMNFGPSVIFRGTLGDAIGSFPYLTQLIVRTDGLVLGTVIPASIGKLQQLQTLVLSGYTRTAALRAGPGDPYGIPGDPYVVNAGVGLVGPLPAGVVALPNLKYLDLSNNTLGGSLPSFVGAKKLAYLDLSGNNRMSSVAYLPDPAYNNSGGFLNMMPTFGAVNSLSYMNLASNTFTIFTSLDVLKNLTYLNLANNYIAIPSNLNASYITPMALTYLNFSNNRLQGGNPLPDLSHLKSLQYLDFSYNDYMLGPLREDYGSLTNLRVLNLADLGYAVPGPIPSSYGNLTNLVELSISCPQFVGTVDECFPSTLGKLHNLRYLNIDVGELNTELAIPNRPVEGLPSFIGNLSQLQTLVATTFTGSEATGAFPANLVNLQNLTSLLLGRLQDSTYTGTHDGNLPQFILSLKALQKLEITHTGFSGPFWPNLGTLQSLRYIDLTGTGLSGTVSDVLSATSNWETVITSLQGPLPSDIGRLKGLRHLSLSSTFSTGLLPASLSQLTALELLNLRSCSFEGPVPDLSATNLRLLELGNNFNLNGSMPRLPKTIQYLNLQFNQFTSLPDIFQGTAGLLYVELTYSGNIQQALPPSLFSLPKLQYLSASEIGVTSIPSNIGRLQELEFLDLSLNSIAQPLPAGIQSLKKLTTLNLKNNFFTGQVPDLSGIPLFILNLYNNSFTGSLPKLATLDNVGLDLSDPVFSFGRNNFSGTVPRKYLFGLSRLYMFDLSRNQLSGLPPDIPAIKDSNELFVDFSHNAFSGTLVRNYFDKQNLASADLSYNQLSGPIPDIYNSYGYPGVLDYNYFTGRPVIDDGTPTGSCIGANPYNPSTTTAPTSFNCFSYNGTDCTSDEVKPQRSAAECAAFCGDTAPEGPCAGHGVCSFKGPNPVCTCNPGFSPATSNGNSTCVTG